MTAPATPVLYARHDGQAIYCRWRPVALATDYKLYVGPATAPTGLEADVADDEVNDDGWFFYVVDDEVGQVYVALSALNAIAEESAKSEVHLNVTGAGYGSENDPTAASRRHKQGAR